MVKVTLIIERFEGNFAVVELNGEMLNVPRTLFPPDTIEGEIFSLVRNTEATEATADRIASLMDELFE